MVDEGGAGQRLDNFLVKLLKGVPKTHVYRLIRSGEVRVNKETSGLLLLAKKRSALLALQAQMRPGAPQAMAKRYAALVLGSWPERLKVVDAPLHKYLDAGGERRVRSVAAEDDAGRRAIT